MGMCLRRRPEHHAKSSPFMGRWRRRRRRGRPGNPALHARRRPMPELRGSSGDQPQNLLTRWFGTPNLHTIDVYESKGGYKALRKALFDMSPSDITNEVKTSGLRGRGGAGFATG